MKNYDSFDFDHRPSVRRASGGFRDIAGVSGPGSVTVAASRFVCRGDLVGGSTQHTDNTQQTSSTSGANSPSVTLNGDRSNVNTGTTLNLGAKSSITTLDPQVTQAGFDAISNTVKSALSYVAASGTAAVNAVSQINKNNSDTNSGLIQSVLSRDQQTAAGVASGGQTDFNSTIVKLAAAAVALLLGLIFLPKLLRS